MRSLARAVVLCRGFVSRGPARPVIRWSTWLMAQGKMLECLTVCAPSAQLRPSYGTSESERRQLGGRQRLVHPRRTEHRPGRSIH